MPPKTARFAYERVRRFLGAEDSLFYYAAFGILNQHCDRIGPYDIGALKRLALPGAFDVATEANGFACLYQCPAALSPVRFRNAKNKAREKLAQVVSADPIAPKECRPDGHNRQICNNCIAPALRQCMDAAGIDDIAERLSAYRKIEAANFREYFLPTALVAVIWAGRNAYLGKIRNNTGIDRCALDAAIYSSDSGIIELADQMINGRKLKWEDVRHL